MSRQEAMEALISAIAHDAQLVTLLILAMGVPVDEATRLLKEGVAEVEEAVMEAERIVAEAQDV